MPDPVPDCPECNTTLELKTYAPSEYGYAAKRSPWCPKCKRWRVEGGQR